VARKLIQLSLAMRKQIVLLLLSCSAMFASYAQTQSLKGSVADTVERKNLVNTTISILRKSDSVLVKFTRADKDGNFAVQGLPEGRFILMATHPYLGDYFDEIEVKAGVANDLGRIIMTPKSKLLAEVILKSGSPIRIKGDTTVYTADSFKVRPGANVEELLRRLPGIQVDRNGQITAMGEKVKKVLVDGEEFFGSDPGIATKNLRADIVKEVEVFDKKSDQAEFTGIDDGVKDKTINLKLKDDKKKGYFGKVQVGGGLKDKFNNDIMMNAFKGKRKLAGYGIMSNTGQTNLDWKDAQNYGGGMDGMTTGMTDDGGMYIMMGGNNEYQGGSNGIPTNWNGGLHFNDKFGNGKQSFNAGYKYSKVNAPGVTETFSKTFLPDTSWFGHTRSNNFNSTIKHAFNMTVDLNIDSSNSLKWTTKANKNNTITTSGFYSEILDEQSRFVNNSTRNSDNKSDNASITSSLLWKHKFKKLSRTMTINTDLSWNKSDNIGMLHSLNNYYIDGILNRRDTTDQQNVRNSGGSGIVSKITYTEPLVKDLFMTLSYQLAYNHNSNERVTSIKDINDKYNNVIDSLSNSFEFDRLVNTPGLNFALTRKKYNANIGASVGLNHFTQRNITEDLVYKYKFTNFFPYANFLYKFKPNVSWRVLGYNGSSTAPTLEQLQPTRVNTDPLNVYIGNPDLKPSFRHSFNSGYNSYNVLKERNIWTNLSVSFTENAFVQYNTVDSIGRRIYQTVNADGNYNVNFYGDYGFKINKTKWNLSFSPNMSISKNVDFVNGIKNNTKSSSYGMGIYLGQYLKDKFNLNFGPEFKWQHSKASVNKAANADYWQISAWGSAGLTLKKSFELNTDVNLELRQKDPRFSQNTNYTKWNAYMLKRFAKDVFEVKFGVYDILNQNRGYNRNFNSYSFTETYNTTLKRFWLLTLTWNISKNGKPATGF
jgi:hypothetical protein